jgi:hypothetical protein
VPYHLVFEGDSRPDRPNVREALDARYGHGITNHHFQLLYVAGRGFHVIEAVRLPPAGGSYTKGDTFAQPQREDIKSEIEQLLRDLGAQVF